MSNSTASTIIGLARDLLRAEAQSDVPAIGNSFMLSALSDANLKWAEAFQGSGAAPLVFQRETGFDLASETAINNVSGTTTATTSITADSHSFVDSAGVAVIWDDNLPDLFAYGSSTSTTFDSVTGLAFAHEDNDPIQPLYKLPSNFGDFRAAPGYGDGVKYGNGLRYMEGPPLPGYFSSYDDGTSKYLWLPRGVTGSVSVWYDKNSTTIDSVDDTVDVPQTYQFFLVWHLVAFAYIGREADANKMLFAQNESNKILQRALRSRNRNQKVRTRPFQRVFRDYTVINGSVIPLA